MSSGWPLRSAHTSLTCVENLNFTPSTTLGDIDLLGEVAGGGTFEQLVPCAESVELEGRRCLVVGLKKLIVGLGMIRFRFSEGMET